MNVIKIIGVILVDIFMEKYCDNNNKIVFFSYIEFISS